METPELFEEKDLHPVMMKLRPAIPEDFYREKDGEKVRLYGMVYFAKTFSGPPATYSYRQLTQHINSRNELAAHLQMGTAYIQADGCTLTEMPTTKPKESK